MFITVSKLFGDLTLNPSFDDVNTFKTKIEYANKMGLGGLMVWAIDLDDDELSALSAISDTEKLDGSDMPFTLVDLDRLFPTELLPPDGVEPKYGLVSFGGSLTGGDTNPSTTGFGFFLVAGDSFAVARLKKRHDEPEPFVFLDCPKNVADQPLNETQTARVVCLSEDVEGCFRLMERGVEGTLVEMPDNFG